MIREGAARPENLAGGRLLARNSILNLLGYAVPLVVAVFSIPILVGELGTDRFGILTLAWVLIGYLSLLDMGLSRALTKLVAEKLGEGEQEDIAGLVWTGLCVMFVLGVVIGFLSMIPLSWFVGDILDIPEHLQAETASSFRLLAFSIPVVITSVGFRGVLEAYQRFDLSNAVRMPLGIYTFASPLLVLPFSNSLVPIVGLLVGGRIAACLVQGALSLRIVPSLWGGVFLKKSMIGPLFRFGGWMTITNIISPLLVYMDRFFISALISITAVAYYATPGEIVTKLWLISGSLIAVLFPAFSASYGSDPGHARLLFERGLKYVFVALFPITLLIVTFAGEGLRLWLGAEFARQSTRVLQWLSVGVFLHALGQVPYTLVQGAGRPDLTAKLHLLEFPVYIFFLLALIKSIGIEGVAVAWTVRMAIDMLGLYFMAHRMLSCTSSLLKRKTVVLLAALGILCLAATLSELLWRSLVFAAVLIVFAAGSWMILLDQDERALIKEKAAVHRRKKTRQDNRIDGI